MRKSLLILGIVSALVMAGAVNTETFSSVDRETEGLMDAWIRLQTSSGGSLVAGTALIRAETVLSLAFASSTEGMPEELEQQWIKYLKASADCLFSFRIALGNVTSIESEDILLASFTRWTTSGEEFLNSVQSTR